MLRAALNKCNAQRTTRAMRSVLLPIHHDPTYRMKMRSTCAMIDASPVFVAAQTTPANSAAPSNQRSVACPPTCAGARAHTKLDALLSPPHATRKPPKAYAPLILTLMRKKACQKASPTQPGRPPAWAGRAAPPERAGVRLRLTVLSNGWGPGAGLRPCVYICRSDPIGTYLQSRVRQSLTEFEITELYRCGKRGAVSLRTALFL